MVPLSWALLVSQYLCSTFSFPTIVLLRYPPPCPFYSQSCGIGATDPIPNSTNGSWLISQLVHGILSLVTALHDVSGLISLEEGTYIPWLGRGSLLSPGAFGQGNLLIHLWLAAILWPFRGTYLRKKPRKIWSRKVGRNEIFSDVFLSHWVNNA